MRRQLLAVNPPLIAYVWGWVLSLPALLLGLMAALSQWLFHDRSAPAFAASALAAGAAAGLLLALSRRRQADLSEMRSRDGLAAVGLAWPLIGLAGALPYWFSGLLPNFADALFESVSGFTTTGATVLSGLDRAPASILLWRALSNWLGGMGVIVLMLAVLPFFGVSGVQLLKNEGSLGQTRLRPRIAQTATVLWLIYLALTAALIILARLAGLSWFEAICNGLSAISTGGFATRDASLGYFQRPALELIFTVFIFAGSLNFALYYQAVRGDWRGLLKDAEARVFVLIILAASLLITASLLWSAHYPDLLTALRHAGFQVISVISTAGFTSDDWTNWPNFAKGLLFALFFLGGCAGSTSGGIKCVRWILIFKSLHLGLRQQIYPRAVFGLRLGDRPVPDRMMSALWSFWALYIVVLAASALALVALKLDLLTAFVASASALGNVGLDLGGGGFAPLPAAAKVILTLEMLLGRLEFFTLLVLFLPEFWRR